MKKNDQQIGPLIEKWPEASSDAAQRTRADLPPMALSAKLHELAVKKAWELRPDTDDEVRGRIIVLLREHGEAVWRLLQQERRTP